jgi:hypothetical protein
VRRADQLAHGDGLHVRVAEAEIDASVVAVAGVLPGPRAG